MALVRLDEAKAYLRVDSADEDAVTASLIETACSLCRDVARISPARWSAVDADLTEESEDTGDTDTLKQTRAVMKVAVLYAVGYLFEHREKADFTDLTLTLRSLLFAMREGVV